MFQRWLMDRQGPKAFLLPALGASSILASVSAAPLFPRPPPRSTLVPGEEGGAWGGRGSPLMAQVLGSLFVPLLRVGWFMWHQIKPRTSPVFTGPLSSSHGAPRLWHSVSYGLPARV